MQSEPQEQPDHERHPKQTQSPSPSTHATSQYYTSTANLEARIAIHRHSTHPEPWFTWLSARLLSPAIISDRNVLEVGAGTGELWTHVSPDVTRSLTLTDFSPAMCDRLRTRPFLREGLRDMENVHVRWCDAASLPFADGSFDVVLANHMLYHVDEPDTVLGELSRVLNPGGTLVVSLNGARHMLEMDELATGVLGRPKSIIRTSAKMTADNARELLEKRLSDVTAERFPGDLEVPMAEPVLAYLESVGGPMSVEQRNEVRSVIERRVAEEGSFRVQKDTVLFTARRRPG
jgi:SAM-dependent methyltransferase